MRTHHLELLHRSLLHRNLSFDQQLTVLHYGLSPVGFWASDHHNPTAPSNLLL
jgi:hypothetical protein